MTAAPTPHVPHVVTVIDHTVHEAVCVTCPWVSGGHLDSAWAVLVAEQHEKGHSVAVETKNENEEAP